MLVQSVKERLTSGVRAVVSFVCRKVVCMCARAREMCLNNGTQADSRGTDVPRKVGVFTGGRRWACNGVAGDCRLWLRGSVG